MANNKPRVIVPKNAADLLGLCKKVYNKHTADGARSPLNALQKHTWDENGSKVAIAQELHDKAESFKRQAEEAYGQRDLLVAELDDSVKSSRDLLLSIFRDSPKDLGQWGFEVDSSVQAAPKAE